MLKIRGLFGRRDDADFNLELQEHLRLLTERYVRQGMTRDDAVNAATRQFGNTTLLREQRHVMQGLPQLDSLWRDSRYAWRALRKHPTFAMSVVLTLALGIGANTAIFSVCNQLMFRPLPYIESDRILMLWEQLPDHGRLMPVAPANFIDWRNQTQAFSAVAAINPFSSLVLTGRGEPVRLAAAAVSWNFFAVLGTPFAMGRGFQEEEDQPDRNRVAILSYQTWVDRFGARSDILGTSVTFNDLDYIVVGVLPRDFAFVGKTSDFQARTRFDVWVPLALNPRSPPRGTHPLRVFARLAPSSSLNDAQAELNVMAANLARAYPEDDKGKGIKAVALREQLTAETRPVLFTLLGAVGFVLAIACANVASLSLARGVSRHAEIALCLAIGASRMRVAQQLLVESLLLGLLGGAAGVGLAFVAIRAATPYLPVDLSRAAGFPMDWRLLLFAGAISVATGLAFGLAPVIQIHGLSASESLRPASRVIGGLRHRLHRSLVVAQIAITLILLVAAGLMGRSLWALLHVWPGFRTDHVLTARITLPRLRYPDAARVAGFQGALFGRLRHIPGVRAAGATAYLPLSGDDNGWAFFIEGRPPLPIGVYEVAKYRAVSDGYFEAIGTPIVNGRAFTPADNQDAPVVVVINESMAGEYWRGRNPVGERLRFGSPAWRTVVGVVGDVRHEGLDGDAKAEMYVPFSQAPNVETTPTIVVRTAMKATALTSAVRAAVLATDASVPLDRITTMDQFVSASVSEPRFRTFLLAALSILALTMASVGIYGLTNYTVVQRTREFGILLAIGATGGRVVRLVLARALVAILAGLGLGLLGSVALTRVIAGWLYGVAALDLQTFVIVSLMLFAVAGAASYVPARRVTSIDPMAALRSE